MKKDVEPLTRREMGIALATISRLLAGRKKDTVGEILVHLGLGQWVNERFDAFPLSELLKILK